MAVLRAVGGVDLVVDVAGFDEADVFADAAGVDGTVVAILGAAEPGGSAPVRRSDGEVVAVRSRLKRVLEDWRPSVMSQFEL